MSDVRCEILGSWNEYAPGVPGVLDPVANVHLECWIGWQICAWSAGSTGKYITGAPDPLAKLPLECWIHWEISSELKAPLRGVVASYSSQWAVCAWSAGSTMILECKVE